MQLLIVLNRKPYDGTDVVWNALRLANNALEEGIKVNIFLINDGVDLARKELPTQGDFDLGKMLKEVIERGAVVKLCKTCIDRCGIGGGEMLEEAQVAGMSDLVEWIRNSEKVISF